ncbi:NXPE family member 4-like isoform X1 [Bufo bufo]|uniref:NXPE family member 4-like isoform X1 n=2 Tax=Bufo bufo TaxID=8384 RepID=UPI001ABE39B9|nr:NXPE family member 4-like isoform X1 [Bufo bufo]XP_040297161.1 NXPE family member 4-like isoform X1 [Bufo bufo]XP_040297162.1 NXPE family member 4-like isoform X1 [Bufo bufo]
MMSRFKAAALCRTYLPLVIAAIFIMSFSWYRNLFQESLKQVFENCLRPPTDEEHLTEIKEVTPSPKTKLQAKIDAMYDKLEKLIPKVTFTHFNTTTSGTKSKVSLVNPQKTYCVGEDFVVRVDMFDHLGNRKTYGGDFIRPRLFSPELGAAVSGIVKDFNNGSYQVLFPLYWAGKVKVHILLFHPSEGVAALWRARHSSLGVLGFEGKFETFGKESVSECGFELNRVEGKEVCEYKDQLYEEAYYCYKVPNFTCESLRDMRGYYLPVSYLTAAERQMFQSPNVAVEIPLTFDAVTVTKCGNLIEAPKPKCQPGMGSPYPSGYFYNNIWRPVYCNMTFYMTENDFIKCLQGKNLFLIGDSTLRQFMMYFTEGIKMVKYFRYHSGGWAEWHKALEAINMEKDMYISYKRHGFPLEHPSFYYFKEDMYISRQIDQSAGGKGTIFMITLGQHFRHFPIKVFIKRAFNIRRAVEHLFIRSPDTKVIIKSENTREIYSPVEMQGDLHGYTQYLVLREVFQGINVGFVDAWDMTVASANVVVHPPGYTFQSIISLAFNFACP